MMIDKQWGDIIQLAGIITVTVGIAYECIFKAPLGYIIISVGCLAFAIGTKIKGK